MYKKPKITADKLQDLVDQGYSNQEIADKVGLNKSTIKTYRINWRIIAKKEPQATADKSPQEVEEVAAALSKEYKQEAAPEEIEETIQPLREKEVSSPTVIYEEHHRRETEALEKEVTMHKTAITELEEEIKALSATVETERSRADHADRQREITDGRLTSTQQSLASKEEQNKDLGRICDAEIKEKKEIIEENNRLKLQVSELEDKLKRAEKAKDSFKMAPIKAGTFPEPKPHLEEPDYKMMYLKLARFTKELLPS